ncbi:uncharacterized protein K460DRAFT_364275 [Cucurbitaria berberidis CBS 394.84]|uniref:Uncharacterized protein n=1 Tax=Cucurbitaria berberidis CBS 394.84 TaxID=1168544 RepID=A0A9P4GL26_9PLEO|nr:uncharacterized protein K460DRAFT_364275 [Cucurbitaria berberidis CBS 394.84]KAF1848308.1 hypothetical protein K460DRAFT_364275 [Cucurbitaria berberidis CBS 394.84]
MVAWTQWRDFGAMIALDIAHGVRHTQRVLESGAARQGAAQVDWIGFMFGCSAMHWEARSKPISLISRLGFGLAAFCLPRVADQVGSRGA